MQEGLNVLQKVEDKVLMGPDGAMKDSGVETRLNILTMIRNAAIVLGHEPAYKHKKPTSMRRNPEKVPPRTATEAPHSAAQTLHTTDALAPHN